MFIVTGGAGFIGSNLVTALNARGEDDITVVDNLSDGHKFANLAGCRIADYLDRDDFRDALRRDTNFGTVAVVFHQGACTVTTDWDGRTMLDNNFQYSKELLVWCQKRRIPMIYASSAAVYGAATTFEEDDQDLRPLNVYGWSKLVFDRWVARRSSNFGTPVIGLRYFNVYGPGEAFKGGMASVVHHFDRQLRESGTVRLFGASHGYGDGEHRRDFVYVGDVVDVNLWAYEQPPTNGVFNVGTGQARSFNDVAKAMIERHGGGSIGYVPFPADLDRTYQAFTEANIGRLRAAGYGRGFTVLEDGVRRTLAAQND